MFLHENNFWKKISNSKVEALDFLRFRVITEISLKNLKNWWIDLWRSDKLRNPPKQFFWTLGGPCGQNESYTGLVRPLFMILYNFEVGPLLADIPETAFLTIFDNLRICDFTGKKHNLLGKLIFRINLFLELFIWFLRLGNFGFWVIYLVFETLSTHWNLGPRFFLNFSKITVFKPKPWLWAYR